MGTYTENCNLYMPSIGERGWGTLVDDNFQKIDIALPFTGTIHLFAGSTAPSGWLICNGQAVSRTTYAALYAVIGTTYGAGDGSTTFNVPNLVNKTVRGASTVGSTGGSDTVTLATTNMPAHTHGGGSLSAASEGAHTHPVKAYFGASDSGGGTSVRSSQYVHNGPATTWISTNGAHTHSVSGTTGSTGSSSAVTVTNAYVMLHYIIKT